MATKDGAKTGGRQKGGLNKRSQAVTDMLNEMGCDPIVGMAKIALGDVKCPACKKGKVSATEFYKLIGKALPQAYTDVDPKTLVARNLDCPMCCGDGVDAITLGFRAQMMKELAAYHSPKLSASKIEGELVGLTYEQKLALLDKGEE